LFQGPIADALTHVGQIAMLRRMAGAPMKVKVILRQKSLPVAWDGSKLHRTGNLIEGRAAARPPLTAGGTPALRFFGMPALRLLGGGISARLNRVK